MDHSSKLNTSSLTPKRSSIAAILNGQQNAFNLFTKGLQMYFLQDMTDAYIEAAYFTDGDGDEIGDGEFTPEFKAAAYFACRNFFWALEQLDIDPDKYNPAQLGHDLWFTRNGHGVGFWDRPEIYGEANAKIFSAMAKAQGTHDAEFI